MITVRDHILILIPKSRVSNSRKRSRVEAVVENASRFSLHSQRWSGYLSIKRSSIEQDVNFLHGNYKGASPFP